MCGLKAAQMHERPFRAIKEPVQLLVALESFLPYGKKIWFIDGLSSMTQPDELPATYIILLVYNLNTDN